MAHLRQSGQDGSYKTVRASFRPWLSGPSPDCSLIARNLSGMLWTRIHAMSTPLGSESSGTYGTYKTVKARFWLIQDSQGKIPALVFRLFSPDCSLVARNLSGLLWSRRDAMNTPLGSESCSYKTVEASFWPCKVLETCPVFPL
jgi:hypothetical protein